MKTVKIKRKKLKEWLMLESLKEQIFKDKRNRIDKIYQYLNLGTGKEDWKDVFWLDISDVLQEIKDKNKISYAIPMFTTKEGKKESGSIAWDYTERIFYSWSNTFAGSYGWSLEEISNLDPDDACALLQEIYVTEQIEKEFDYSLSEIAYPYNPHTKKSKYKPLTRPIWMRAKTKKVKKHTFLKSMLPMGEIINLGEITDETIESGRGFSDT